LDIYGKKFTIHQAPVAADGFSYLILNLGTLDIPLGYSLPKQLILITFQIFPQTQ
jgi:hypothetical protein